MKKQKPSTENYLEYIPVKSTQLSWHSDDKGIVTLDIENTGVFNRIAQNIFGKPKVTHIHLDKLGSFIWPLIDGKKNILELGEEVDARFSDDAAPLYERMAKYFQILESYHFITFK